MGFMRVLFAIDGSAHSFAAVSQVGGLLAPGSELAFYCSPPEVRLQSSSVGADVVARARQSLAASIHEEARRRLPAALRENVHPIVGTRDPRQGIVAAAEQWFAELIVVGARGLGRLDRMLLGSVSRAVVHTAKVPVWVARSPGAAGEASSPRRILLACQSPELARPAAELLAGFRWPAETQCQALTVMFDLFGGRVPDWLQQQARSPDTESMVQVWAREHDEAMRGTTARMQQFVQSLPAGFPACQSVVAEGDAASQVLAVAAREQTDLIVMGVHHKGFFTSAILGSTCEAVLNHAACSVLTVPHRERP
jgi:nucleotide-binding universal stress UspA family protein